MPTKIGYERRRHYHWNFPGCAVVGHLGREGPQKSTPKPYGKLEFKNTPQIQKCNLEHEAFLNLKSKVFQFRRAAPLTRAGHDAPLLNRRHTRHRAQEEDLKFIPVHAEAVQAQ